MTNEILTIELSQKTKKALSKNEAYIGETRKTEDGNYVTELCVESDEYEHTFEVEHNGTEASFISGAINELEKYNVTPETIETIVDSECDCLNDIRWYIDMMDEFESICIWLLRSLDELDGYRRN